MREIKFRAWNTNNNRMYFDVQNGIDLGLYIGFGDALTQINLKVMQFTGLKDKNGKEIYEGDIIKFKYYNVYRRWWSNLEQIPVIEQECAQQRSDVKEQLTTVVYDDGRYILRDGYPVTLHDVSRGYRFKEGQTNSCNTEEKQWDFEVIGNIYSNPELLTPTP